jgi:hypothetical protein
MSSGQDEGLGTVRCRQARRRRIRRSAARSVVQDSLREEEEVLAAGVAIGIIGAGAVGVVTSTTIETEIGTDLRAVALRKGDGCGRRTIASGGTQGTVTPPGTFVTTAIPAIPAIAMQSGPNPIVSRMSLRHPPRMFPHLR